MKKYDLTWTAGIIDGEGCITLGKYKRKNRKNSTRYYVRIMVHMTTFNCILKLHSLWGGGLYKHMSKRAHCKPTYIWEVDGSRAINCIKYIYPYLLDKKEQANTILDNKKKLCNSQKHWKKATEKIILIREMVIKKLKELHNEIPNSHEFDVVREKQRKVKVPK